LVLACLRAASALPCYQGELSADKAVELALLHSPEAALAGFQRDLQRAERERVASESRLKVGVGVLAAQQNTSMIYATGSEPNFAQLLPASGTFNLNAVAMLPIYNGGWLRHRLAAAERAERASEARREVALRLTTLQARRVYFEVFQARAEVEARQQEVQARNELLVQAQNKFRLGKEARFVVLRAEAELASVQQLLNTAESTFEQREGQLKAVLGLSWESRFDYPQASPPPLAPVSLADSLEEARSQRPDLVATRLAIEEGDHRLLASLAEYSPRLSLAAMVEGMGASGMPWNQGYSVGLSLSFPLYDGGQRAAQSEAARLEVEMSKTRLTQLELNLEQEVTVARSGLLQALRNSDLAELELSKAQEELRISRLRFELGRAIYLEVLDSLALLSRARSNRLNAQFEAQRRQADYFYALGRFP
jgi:outer membrane protein TolC